MQFLVIEGNIGAGKTTRNLLQNIKKRGREYEQEISLAYLDKIRKGYFDYVKQITSFPVLIVDVNKIDFVKNPDHYHLLKEVLIENSYKSGINRLVLP